MIYVYRALYRARYMENKSISKEDCLVELLNR